jgi:hypothetical protein
LKSRQTQKANPRAFYFLIDAATEAGQLVGFFGTVRSLSRLSPKTAVNGGCAVCRGCQQKLAVHRFCHRKLIKCVECSDICNASSTMSTMASATQPSLQDVLSRMSAQIAALTQEVQELRAVKQEVHELRCLADACLVQLEESNENMVSMSAEATQSPADHEMEGPFQQVKGKQRRKRRPSVAFLEDQAVEPGPSQESPSAEAPKKVKKTNPQAPQVNPNRSAPAKQTSSGEQNPANNHPRRL